MTPRLERFARVGRLAVVGLLAALSVAALAAEQHVRLSVRTDRPDAVYAMGEMATFTIELTDLAKGAHSLLLRAQDEAKNASVLKLNFESP